VAALFATIVYMTHISDSIPRLFFGYFFGFYFGFSFVLSTLVNFVMRSIQAHHKRQTVIFTDRKDRKVLIKNLLKNGADDFEVIGLADLSGKTDVFYRVETEVPEELNTKAAEAGFVAIDPEVLEYKFKKDENDPISFLKNHNVDLAIIAVDHLDKDRIRNTIDLVGEMGIESMMTLDSFAADTFDSKMEDFGTLEVVRFAPRIFSEAELFIKRVFDIIGGLVGCIFCLIIGIFVAPLILIEDGGPVIFKQKRVGKNGKYFNMYKFRSMYNDAEERRKKLMKSGKNEMDGAMFKMKDDPRITKVGKFIRKTSLDEFPQFFNVLKGDMSLVGTRPPMIDEYQQYSIHHKRRLSIKPGITGLWQTSGRSEITDFEEVVRLDCYYIDHYSVAFDIKILLMTVVAVITGKGSE
jgi:exopolysaccharide biosynthesis polyprenyl glycosylphosphotransferase